jgi:hypothetical protein
MAHVLMKEDPEEGETTCNLSGGKNISASTALMKFPPVFTKNETVKVLPTSNCPVEGPVYRYAPPPWADAKLGANIATKPKASSPKASVAL